MKRWLPSPRHVPCSLAVTTEPKSTIWFRTLSMNWRERPLFANARKYTEKCLVDKTTNVGLESQMQ